jgi:hypothetical protein
MLRILLFLSGSCSKTEVFKQYFRFAAFQDGGFKPLVRKAAGCLADRFSAAGR